MDVNDLTAEELRKLADEKALSGERVIDVDGMTVHIDVEKCKSWKAFTIMSSVTEELTFETLRAMLDFIEYITDVDEAQIIEHCGGEDASLESVVSVVAQIVSECYPKN